MNRRFPLLLLGGVTALVALAVLAVPRLVPMGGLRGQIEQQVSTATGRSFRIHGGLRFTLLPVPGLSADDVTLANMPGGHAQNLVAVDRLRIGVRFWPLLSGHIVAARIVLEHPTIALEVAPGGRANWQLELKHDARIGAGISAKTDFAGIEIADGQLSYDNDKLGIHRAIDHLDAKVDVTRLDHQAGVTGGFDVHGRHLDYAITATTVQTLLEGKPTRTNVALTSRFLNAGFIGAIASDGTVTGFVSLRTPSVKDVAAWLGHPISAGNGLAALDIRAVVAAHEHDLSLTRIVAQLDGMHVTGYLDADLEKKTPEVAGALTFDQLNLNTYLQQGRHGPAEGGPPGTSNPGWSRTPFKLDVVKLANGKLSLNVGRLLLLHLRLESATIAVTLRDGLMSANINPMQLYGGTGAALLMVDAGGPQPRFANKLAFTNIAMAPFLADTIGAGKIDGGGTITLDVASQGTSPDQVMRGLSGKGSVTIGPGSVGGVDMGRVARTIATILSAGATGDSTQTPFDRFTGSFTITDGVLANDDLRLSSAFINMTGAGHLDLGNRTIAYRIEPKASIGGRLNLLDVGVPFIISGSWDHVRYQADIAGAVSDLVQSVLGKSNEVLSGLGARKSPNGKKKNPSFGDKLKNLFGIH